MRADREKYKDKGREREIEIVQLSRRNVRISLHSCSSNFHWNARIIFTQLQYQL